METKENKKWFVKVDTDTVGTDAYHIIEAESKEDAEEQARELAYDNWQSFDDGTEQEECEKSGIEFLEDEHYYYEVEEYDKTKHEDYL